MSQASWTSVGSSADHGECGIVLSILHYLLSVRVPIRLSGERKRYRATVPVAGKWKQLVIRSTAWNCVLTAGGVTGGAKLSHGCVYPLRLSFDPKVHPPDNVTGP